MPRTVVLFLSNFQSGGTEWFALRLARGLSRHNIKPIFLVVRPEGDLLPLIDKNIEIVSLSGSGNSFPQLLTTLPKIVRFLKKRKPDAFLGGLTLLNIIAAIAIKLSHVPTRFIVIEHMSLHEQTFSFLEKLKKRIKLLFIKYTYESADTIIVVSQTAKDDLVHQAKIDPTRPIIINNPIIPDNFEELAAQPPSHPWLTGTKRPREMPVILGIGRLLPNKDFSNLLHAFAHLIKTKDARLIIFGEGEDRAHLEKTIAELNLLDHALLAGQIDNVFSALSAADLLVLPSRREAFGNVIVEALACGTPVVSTDSGGPREILEDGHYGALVPPSDSKLLAEAICAALKETPDKDALVARGKVFSVEESTQAYLKLIN